MQTVVLTSFSYLFMAFLSCSPPPKEGKSSKKEMCHCKYTAQENGLDKLLKQKKTASDGVGEPAEGKEPLEVGGALVAAREFILRFLDKWSWPHLAHFLASHARVRGGRRWKW